MGYLTVDCNTCGGSWNVYHTTNWTDDYSRTCPHCFAEIDPETWEAQVLPAFTAITDANTELARVHEWDKRPLFRIHYTEDQDAEGKLEHRISEMEARLGRIEDKLEGMADPLEVALLEGRI